MLLLLLFGSFFWIYLKRESLHDFYVKSIELFWIFFTVNKILLVLL